MKKVLLVVYYWPPAGGPGVQRWLKFVTYLKDFGIEPIVYVPENPNYPILDDSLKQEVPNGIRVLTHPIKEPYRWGRLLSKNKTKQMSRGIIGGDHKGLLEKILLAIRGNFFVPDARKSWIKPSVSFLKQLLREEQIKTIITTGPPHSLHLIGMQLKEQLGLTWIADFRDPWTTIHYHEQLQLLPWIQKKHLKLEEAVLNQADQVVVTSPSTAREFNQKTKRPICVITNGYDRKIPVEVPLDTHFSITHIGSLLSDRNPEVLWGVLSELLIETTGFKEHLRIQMVGITDSKILTNLKEYGLQDHLVDIGYCTHQLALEYQSKSQLLLLLESPKEKVKGIIPGKLFEYMSSNRPILAIGPSDWDVCEVVQNTQIGSCFNYSQKKAIKEYVLSCYQLFLTQSLQSNATNIEVYHRKNLTATLAKIIHGTSC